MTETREIKYIFIASPGDLRAERERFRTILDKVNRLKSHTMGLRLEPLGWEDTQPGMGRPQELINKEVERCHLFVMLLWKRWGTQPAKRSKYSSGTEEEFELARHLYSERGFPNIYLYFRESPKELLDDPGPQFRKVQDFRKRIEKERTVFYKSYATPDEWEDLLTEHISKWLDDLRPPSGLPSLLTQEDEGRSAKREQHAKMLVEKQQRAERKLQEIAVDLGRQASVAVKDDRLTQAEELFAKAEETYPVLSVIHDFGLYYVRVGSLDAAEEKFRRLEQLAAAENNGEYLAAAQRNLEQIYETRDDLMVPQQIIRRKRDGLPLLRRQIFDFIRRYCGAEIPDYQASALLMAIYCHGLDTRETADLVKAMIDSGQVLDLSEFQGPKVDMHSTGGVGDKTPVIVAPAAAAGGLVVPTMSGRGLGYTGGTLDKLESIPGFRTSLTLGELRRVLQVCGVAFFGQTYEWVPADRLIYALRDATGTVESIPLISASILSKKLAEGIDGLILDVKAGSGAFMKKFEDARELAGRMVEIGTTCGKRVYALITNMSQPLGRTVGNALEIIESIETLKGHGPRDLVELSREITAHMFLVSGIDRSIEGGRTRFDSVIGSGQALEKFAQLIGEQGGDPRVVEDYSRLPKAEHQVSVVAPKDGYLGALEAEVMGRMAMVLGAGREYIESIIDPAVGLVFEKKVGDQINAGEPICTIHANDVKRLARAKEMIQATISISPEPPLIEPLILGQIGESLKARHRKAEES